MTAQSSSACPDNGPPRRNARSALFVAVAMGRMTAVVALPVLALMAAVVAGPACASPPLAAPAADQPTLTVLDWNLNYGLAGDARALRLLEEADADLILLQETTPDWERVLRQLAGRYPHMTFHHCCGAGGLAVLSKHPIAEAEVLPALTWFPAWRGVVESSVGPVQVLNVHLRPPFDDAGSLAGGLISTPAIREREMTHFAAVLDDSLPTVIAGDFNEAGGGALDVLKRRGMVSALERAAVSAATWRWPGVPIRLRLDHVFYDGRSLTLTAAEVVEAGASDHLPIVARFARRQVATARAGAPACRGSRGR